MVCNPISLVQIMLCYTTTTRLKYWFYLPIHRLPNYNICKWNLIYIDWSIWWNNLCLSIWYGSYLVPRCKWYSNCAKLNENENLCNYRCFTHDNGYCSQRIKFNLFQTTFGILYRSYHRINYSKWTVWLDGCLDCC